MIAATFLFFLGLFVLVGLLSYRQSRADRRNYFLADQNVKPWLVGLSAVATNNSGYMFIGVIGYTYVTGLPATWLMFGWIVGDFLASHFVHRRLREASTVTAGDTFPGVLAGWQGRNFPWVRHLGGIITVLFLGTYAAAQLTAGSKALHVLFGWPQQVGAVIGAGIVLLYCLAGGIRASIWTDAAQSVVMITAMTVMLAVGINSLGGIGTTWDQLNSVSPTYMELIPSGLSLGDTAGPALFIIGWLFAGFSVIGQPESAAFDPELALPTIALELLHPVGVGMVLAGIFAATMSTADSLILSCSGSLSENLARLPKGVWVAKLSTVLVTVFALWLALSTNDNVFDLVISSWAVLAACFGPLLMVLALGQRPNELLAVAMMLTGVVGVYAWLQFDYLSAYYEGTLAICAGFLVFAVGKALGFIQEPGTAERKPEAGLSTPTDL